MNTPRPFPVQPQDTVFSGDWAAWKGLRKWWECVEAHIVPHTGRDNVRWLELGSHEGRSATGAALIFDGPDSHITCVDYWFPPSEWCTRQEGATGPAEQRFDNNIRAVGAASRVTKLKGHWLSHLETFGRRNYHGVYIDAEHNGVAVLAQSELLWDMLVPGGFMVWDDYLLQPPKDVSLLPVADGIEAFLSLHRGEYTMLFKEWQVFIRKNS
jgi:hypothetical protein